MYEEEDLAASFASTQASRLPRPPSALRQGARTSVGGIRPLSSTLKTSKSATTLRPAATGHAAADKSHDKSAKKVIDHEVDLIALHDDLMKTKKQLAKAEEEKNILNNRLMRLEQSVRKKDREIDEVLVKGAQAAAGESCAGSFLYMKSERNLLESLRKRTTDLEKALSERDIELAALRQNTKFSKVNEMQSQSATYLAEARRLRLLLQKSHEQLQQQMLSCQTNHPANFQLLQARADTLTTENERLTAQLASAVETAEMLMSTNQALAHEVESHASHQAALEATNAAQQRKITEQQQQLIVARNAAAKAAAAAHAAAGVAQQFAQQHGQWPQSPTANASPVSQQPAVKSPKKLVEAHADEQYE